MISDRSWQALFKPGEATDYFDIARPRKLAPALAGFDLCNAWYLAEVSRFVYYLDKLLGLDEDIDSVAVPGDSDLILLEKVIDTSTSTLAVLFKSTCVDIQSGQQSECYVLSFCGSNDILDWKINIQASQDDFPGCGKVHRGFLRSFDSVSERLFETLVTLKAPLFITGHSLGGALATLCARYLVSLGVSLDSCYTFGSPRVGNQVFAHSMEGIDLYRVVNNCDIVTTMPVSAAQNEYRHAGKAVYFDDQGELIEGLDEEQVLSRQIAYIPSLKRYLNGELLLEKLKNIRYELPAYLSDHAPVNYVSQIRAAVLDE